MRILYTYIIDLLHAELLVTHFLLSSLINNSPGVTHNAIDSNESFSE